MSGQRAMTIAETLIVSVILGLMLLAIAGAVPPLLAAPARAQAKADSISPASSGLYLVERDLRMSDASGVFACTGWPAVCGSGTLGTSDTALVIATAADSSELGAQFLTAGQHPSWRGFMVYWQRAPGGDVYRTYEAAPLISQYFDPSQPGRSSIQTFAQDAVTAAFAVADPQIAMHHIASLSASVDTTTSVTSLQVIAAGQAGYEQNTSTFDDDVLERN